MAVEVFFKVAGIKGESAMQPMRMSSSVRQKLESMGMTTVGITQLTIGQPITNRNDQLLVQRIAAHALNQSQ